MRYILALSFVILNSCQTIETIKPSDPHAKIRDGYKMLEEQRPVPALLLFNEAYDIVEEDADQSLKASVLVALGEAYKYKDRSTYDWQKSISSYEGAAKILASLKFNQRLSQVYWGLAQVYALEKKADKSCEYVNKSARAYFQPSDSTEDRLNPRALALAIPFFKKSKAQNFNFLCR